MMKNKRFVGILLTVAMSVGMTGNAFAKTWERPFGGEINKSKVVKGIRSFIEGGYEGGIKEEIKIRKDGIKLGNEGGYDFGGDLGLKTFFDLITITNAGGGGEGDFENDIFIGIDEYGNPIIDFDFDDEGKMNVELEGLGKVVSIEMGRERNAELFPIDGYEGLIVSIGEFGAKYAAKVTYIGNDGKEHEIEFKFKGEGGAFIFNYEEADGGYDIDTTIAIDGEEYDLKDFIQIIVDSVYPPADI